MILKRIESEAFSINPKRFIVRTTDENNPKKNRNRPTIPNNAKGLSCTKNKICEIEWEANLKFDAPKVLRLSVPGISFILKLFAKSFEIISK